MKWSGNSWSWVYLRGHGKKLYDMLCVYVEIFLYACEKMGIVFVQQCLVFKLKYTVFFCWNQDFLELGSDFCSRIVHAQVETV